MVQILHLRHNGRTIVVTPMDGWPILLWSRSTPTPKPHVEVEVTVTLRPTVSRPVSLGVRGPSGTRDQFYFLLEIFFRQLRFCNFVAPSPTRERVCNLLVQLLLGLARAVTLGSKFRRTHGHILLRLLQPGGPGSRIYFPLEQGGPVIHPGTGFHFVASYDSQGLRWRYSNPPPHVFKPHYYRTVNLIAVLLGQWRYFLSRGIQTWDPNDAKPGYMDSSKLDVHSHWQHEQ
jgi:hypothetical protein